MSGNAQQKVFMNAAKVLLVLAAIAGTAFVQRAIAQTEVRRATISSGGGLRSAAGRYELSGYVSPAGAAVSRGDRVALTGGFWYHVPPGDSDGSGGVGLTDVAAFESCLTGPSEFTAPTCASFDTNRSGAVDLRDFAETQVRFSGT